MTEAGMELRVHRAALSVWLCLPGGLSPGSGQRCAAALPAVSRKHCASEHLPEHMFRFWHSRLKGVRPITSPI